MTSRLDRVDALPPGAGRLDLFAFASPGAFGGALTYEHRITPGMSAYAEAHAGRALVGDRWANDWAAIGGLRWRW